MRVLKTYSTFAAALLLGLSIYTAGAHSAVAAGDQPTLVNGASVDVEGEKLAGNSGLPPDTVTVNLCGEVSVSTGLDPFPDYDEDPRDSPPPGVAGTAPNCPFTNP